MKLKKIVSLALACVMSLTLLAGCGGNNQEASADNAAPSTEATVAGDDAADAVVTPDTPHHKIAVGYYTDNGAALTAIKAYLNGVADPLNCEFEVFTISTYDENANLTKVQEMISAG